MKTHVLTFAKHFMKGHPKEGEPTNFKQKIIDTFRHDRPAQKIHTIRGNYPYWKERIDEVNEGEARLSLRNWKGKPYRSKQNEFLSLEKAGYQKVHIDSIGNVFAHPHSKMGKSKNRLKEVAKNDGLTESDFLDWFDDKLPFNGIIIHFTDFRY